MIGGRPAQRQREHSWLPCAHSGVLSVAAKRGGGAPATHPNSATRWGGKATRLAWLGLAWLGLAWPGFGLVRFASVGLALPSPGSPCVALPKNRPTPRPPPSSAPAP